MLPRSCCTVTSSCKLYCFTMYGTSRQTCFANTERGELVVSLPIHLMRNRLFCTVVDRFSHVWTRFDVGSVGPTVLVVLVVEAACRSCARRFRRRSFPCATYHAVEVQHVPLRLFEGGGVGRACRLSQRSHRVRLIRRVPQFASLLRSVPFALASCFLSTRPSIPFEPHRSNPTGQVDTGTMERSRCDARPHRDLPSRSWTGACNGARRSCPTDICNALRRAFRRQRAQVDEPEAQGRWWEGMVGSSSH